MLRKLVLVLCLLSIPIPASAFGKGVGVAIMDGQTVVTVYDEAGDVCLAPSHIRGKLKDCTQAQMDKDKELVAEACKFLKDQTHIKFDPPLPAFPGCQPKSRQSNWKQTTFVCTHNQ